MATGTQVIEVSLPDDLLKRIDERVRKRGGDRSHLIQEFIERGLREEETPHADMTFAEILKPAHEYTRQMGYTEEEIGDFVDDEIKAYRAERSKGSSHA